MAIYSATAGLIAACFLAGPLGIPLAWACAGSLVCVMGCQAVMEGLDMAERRRVREDWRGAREKVCQD